MPFLPPIRSILDDLLRRQLEEWRQKLRRTPDVITGPGTPEGVVSAEPGTLYINSAGSAGRFLYVKASGLSVNGWELVTSEALNEDADTRGLNGASLLIQDDSGVAAALVSDASAYTIVQRMRLNSGTATAAATRSGAVGDIAIAIQFQYVSTPGELNYRAFVNTSSSYELVSAFAPNHVTIGEWFVIAFRWNAGTLATFLNGSQLTTAHVGAAFSATSDGDPTDTFYAMNTANMAVSETAVWSAALTDLQIASMGGPVIDTGAIESLTPGSWIRCGDNSGDSANILVDVGSGGGSANWTATGSTIVDSTV